MSNLLVSGKVPRIQPLPFSYSNISISSTISFREVLVRNRARHQLLNV